MSHVSLEILVTLHCYLGASSLFELLKTHSVCDIPTDFFLLFFLFVHIMYLLVMIGAILKRPRTPPTNNPAMDYQTADSEHVLKRSRPFGVTDEV